MDIVKLKYRIIEILKEELPLGHVGCEPECASHYWEMELVGGIANKICQYVTKMLDNRRI